MSEPKTKSTVSTLQTALSIVHTLQRVGSARIDELATELDLASSTVHRHLLTLRDEGYVEKKEQGYGLGMRFLTLGGAVQANLPVFKLAKQKTDHLAENTGERSQFVVEEQGYRYYLYTQSGENAVQTGAALGRRGDLHTSASGKAILAALPDDRVDAILDTNAMAASTPNTITDRDELFAALETIREAEIAFNDEESTVGLRAVGAAVCGSDGYPIGALSVSGPARRLEGDLFRKELPHLVLASANEMELKIAYEIE